MKVGFKLFAEGFGPREIVEQAVRAEQAGFDFVEVSDHFHPWLYSHGHSGFVWSMLAAVAERTETIGLATGVTCPILRVHPAIVAQAAATTALLSEGRFSLGLGSGERLNEHVVGRGWPNVTTRHRMLREAIDIIRLLWSGGYHSYEGKHLVLEDARVFDLPDEPPPIIVAAGGEQAALLASELGDGLFCTEPDKALTRAYGESGGVGPRYGEVPLAWAADEVEALDSAREVFRFGLLGWKVQAELPNPVNFEAATALIGREAMRDAFGYGPDPERHLEAVRQFTEAGFDHLCLVNAGPDTEGFFTFFEEELAGPIRRLGGRAGPAA
ncbi:TIGR03557 family F420-dependent LLM class oxidoreductase [Streptomonospora nanhaiensis]|uniref:TIGR03557 family F420-dependent LLM class oxidoreductase n=1 Tax=Streptomonospora nanhaiensis TaxID=1323731 RepID=A0ABY6YM78_9ACTN|nr:TIGR03557 family F420-dependent LLM class oxidoreductase [Streptomonospora nanhaiensis]WAE73336.1 TIGR03557 family F420-dependent LLM class oxidoreductase [Streptomonospora nanhaiensis]